MTKTTNHHQLQPWQIAIRLTRLQRPQMLRGPILNAKITPPPSQCNITKTQLDKIHTLWSINAQEN